MINKNITKISVALSHLLISAIIFSMIFGILLFFWYPSPYFYASGGWAGLKIAALVDLVLGPILTFVVFNIGKCKKELLTDLSIIVMIQMTALFWGVNTIYQQRPVASVFWGGSFLAVTAADLKRHNYNLEHLKEFGDDSPVLIYLKDPENKHIYYQPEELSSKKIAISPFYRTDLYRPFKDHFNDLSKYKLDMKYLVTTDAEVNAKLMTILDRKKSKIDDYQYYKLYSNYNSIIFIFNSHGEIIDNIIAPLDFG